MVATSKLTSLPLLPNCFDLNDSLPPSRDEMPLTNEHIPTLNPNRTLAHFYKAQTSLRRFLPSLFPPALDLVLFSPGDPQTLLDLLDHTLVCLEPTYSVRRVWDVVEPFQGTMSEVSFLSSFSGSSLVFIFLRFLHVSSSQLLNRAIVQIFKASKTGKPSNQLANGFTASSYGYSVSSPSPSPLLSRALPFFPFSDGHQRQLGMERPTPGNLQQASQHQQLGLRSASVVFAR